MNNLGTNLDAALYWTLRNSLSPCPYWNLYGNLYGNLYDNLRINLRDNFDDGLLTYDRGRSMVPRQRGGL